MVARTRTPRLTLVSTTVGAAHADVHPRTLRRWIAEGRISGYRVGPRLVKVDIAELEAFVRPIPTTSI